ncbi:MAG: hypothetical protein ABMA13_10750 [Chthoniobacteraceae bacterium]
MKIPVLLCSALVFLATSLRAQVPASPPAPNLTVVKVPLLLPAQPGKRPVADIANVEVRLAGGIGGPVFTQRVPPDASKVLQAVTAAIEKLHPGKLKSQRIEITFTGMVAANDLAASGLGLAIGLDAALGGWKPDPGCMAMGTFEADGDVQPVKDAIPRLLAVMKAGAGRVIMTEKQVAQVTDMMVSAGPAIFSTTQFFAVNSYEDAKPIADTTLTPEMVKGLGFFGNVQQALKAAGAKPEEMLRNDEVKEDLRSTMVSMPSCVSARLLLRATTGQFDKLSAEGTFYAIENLAPTIFTVVQSSFPNDLTKLPNATVQAEIAKLEASRPHFDVNSLPVLDAVIGYGEVVRSYTERPAESVTENADRSRALLLTARAVLEAMAKFKAVQR